MHGGQLGFPFFDNCNDKGFIQYWYVLDVLGEERKNPKATAYYRVGYCPAEVHGDFVKAKTLLFPGFKGTPEYGLILNSNLPQEQKAKMMADAYNLDATHLYESQDFSLIKWFHDNGQWQVVQMMHTVFDYD